MTDHRHNRSAASTRGPVLRDGPRGRSLLRHRLEVLAPRLHALGARPLLELLVDIAATVDRPHEVLGRAEAFARLTPAMVAAAAADRFPPRATVVPAEWWAA